MPSDYDMMAWALAYARVGWRVFPCWPIRDGRCACGKDCCTSGGKHPLSRLAPKGLHNATTDEATIRRWWTSWRDANIAIRTGDGLLVVDIDPKNGGDDSLSDLLALHGPLPDTATVITGSGGTHFYFCVDGRYRNAANLGGWDGIDVRADGGYVVAPPSLHLSGRRYEWELSSVPDDWPDLSSDGEGTA